MRAGALGGTLFPLTISLFLDFAFVLTHVSEHGVPSTGLGIFGRVLAGLVPGLYLLSNFPWVLTGFFFSKDSPPAHWFPIYQVSVGEVCLISSCSPHCPVRWVVVIGFLVGTEYRRVGE